MKFFSSSSTNFFRRFKSNQSNFVYVENDSFLMKFFELKSILNKKKIAREIEYLMRWKKYESKHDVWRNLLELNNVMKLIKKYKNVIKKIVNRLFNRLLLKDKSASLKFFISSKFFVSFSSKQKKSIIVSIEKKIFIDKSRLFKINQKTLILWKFFTKSSSFVTIDTSSISRQKFVVVISLRKSYTNAFTFSTMTKIR